MTTPINKKAVSIMCQSCGSVCIISKKGREYLQFIYDPVRGVGEYDYSGCPICGASGNDWQELPKEG